MVFSEIADIPESFGGGLSGQLFLLLQSLKLV